MSEHEQWLDALERQTWDDRHALLTIAERLEALGCDVQLLGSESRVLELEAYRDGWPRLHGFYPADFAAALAGQAPYAATEEVPDGR
jgi:hypothetical protein